MMNRRRKIALVLMALAALLYFGRAAIAGESVPTIADFRRNPAALAQQLKVCNARRAHTRVCQNAHKARLGFAADLLRGNKAQRRPRSVPLILQGSLAI